jgi:hypothetical protein
VFADEVGWRARGAADGSDAAALAAGGQRAAARQSAGVVWYLHQEKSAKKDEYIQTECSVRASMTMRKAARENELNQERTGKCRDMVCECECDFQYIE